MKLALFDLDNTLLAGDSDHAWGEWLCQQNLVDSQEYKTKNDLFFEQYQAGKLDPIEYLNFSLAILGRTPMEQLQEWHRQFMQEVIEPIILKKGEALLAKHRQEGYTTVIITATNRFITEPIAKRLGVDALIASECEIINGHYTGKTTGIPCFQEGKVTRLQHWIKEHQAPLQESYFYSDSKNDIPLLSIVEHPVAVDPDQYLKQYAKEHGWPILSLRD